MQSEISVCIATYRRPEGLERLLKSLIVQNSAPPFDVTVVDNDIARSGEAVARRYSDQLQLSYFVEPARGLAKVRNFAVGASGSPFIAFIDDDEWAAPEWLSRLKHVADLTQADAVIGPVRQVFAAEVPEFVRACGMFNRPSQADGASLPWFEARTGNALVRRDSLPHPRMPFATQFDLVGGEDTHMFKRTIDGGARIVAASDAVVFEYRPAARANLRWIVRRAIRIGGTISELQGGTLRAGRVKRLVRAGQEAVYHAARVAVLWRKDRREGTRQLIGACEEIGKIAHIMGIRIEEYRNHS
jgi:succinoglycan biosynthesis protein ExoM